MTGLYEDLTSSAALEWNVSRLPLFAQLFQKLKWSLMELELELGVFVIKRSEISEDCRGEIGCN